MQCDILFVVLLLIECNVIVHYSPLIMRSLSSIVAGRLVVS